ncbi:hypothetical protein IG631_18466 [Alternaria alternata]|nr:hypothetical protein IG631_18466 [Alternaria alternata]
MELGAAKRLHAACEMAQGPDSSWLSGEDRAARSWLERPRLSDRSGEQ